MLGAKRCLLEKGYARTTARDIVAASGTNLASIGYHFGSKEELLNAALFEAMEEWGEELKATLGDVGAAADPAERFERFWTRVIDSFATQRPLWAATFEVFAQIERVPELRTAIANGLQEGRVGWAQLLQGLDVTRDGKKAVAVGSFYQALMTGVLVQWLVDPERAPSARDLTEALRTIVACATPDAG